jgi:glycosyltransferase involved in cell wall biosynthesis
MFKRMSAEKPFFSILLPTTGRVDLMRHAIQSLGEQSCGDWELVVADLSGSEEARRISSGDERIRYLHVTPPPGEGIATWDLAAKAARGSYVLWLDDDNYLLPFALELFKRELEHEARDIITANHLYYYDGAHPRFPDSIGIIPWHGGKKAISLPEVLKNIYSYGRRGAGEALPRFHFSATAINREVIEHALARLGRVLFTDMPNIHSLQAILFSFARDCAFVDWPVVLIGRLGVSMSQDWSMGARKRFSTQAFPLRLSPFTGYTRINGILENLLRVKEALPDRLGDISIDYERFARYYLSELFYLDSTISWMRRDWKNFFLAIQTLPISEDARRDLEHEGRKKYMQLPVIYLLRRLRFNYLLRALKSQRAAPTKSSQEQFSGNAEFALPLPKELAVHSIEDLARTLPSFLREELKTGFSPPR